MKEVENIVGLYFDGRKDTTLTLDHDICTRKKIVKEEHISIIGEPGGIYLSHATVKSGTAENIAAGILDATNVFNLSNLTSIGCDGTVCNTGT